MLFVEILKMVLPVLIAILVGYFAKRSQLFDLKGLNTLKIIISQITLPLVLFNAFFTMDYSLKVLLLFGLMVVACGVSVLLGFLLKRFVKPYGTFLPFLITCYEVGMLGYALFGLLVGTNKTSILAMPDIGQTVFAYTVYLGLLKATDGKKPTIKDLVLNVLNSRTAMGMFIGIILGLTGVGKIVAGSVVSGIYTDLIAFLTAPTACIILIVVGYELSFKKDLLKPVFITAGLRLIISILLLVGVSLALFAIIPFDKDLMIALMILFSLPAPFVIPLFADVKDDGEYISTTLSVSTLLTIVCFILISIYNSI